MAQGPSFVISIGDLITMLLSFYGGSFGGSSALYRGAWGRAFCGRVARKRFAMGKLSDTLTKF
ncbi:hypothetical protein [Bartonella raoultii]|uniref:hypothetical protein n=1 Tax=Bartonella raoultii TaxID=1457020 RepID=UPI001ABB57F9|nr:hypothetical protein [Bartonella raoultii]